MSRENSQTKLIDSNDDEDKFDSKHKPWVYPDSYSSTHQNQNRTCCSPADEIEELEKEVNNLNTTDTVEAQTNKSALFLLKQDTIIDDNNKKSNTQIVGSKELLDNKQMHNSDNSDERYHQINEFEIVKQIENDEDEKTTEKLPVNANNPEVFNEYNQTDLDQSMNYALCYNETNLDEEKKGNTSLLPKNDLLCTEETIEEDKIKTVKSKGSFNKEPTRNKKEMFSNTSRSFKEIFNFFKDRDKKRSAVDNTKISTLEGTKLLKHAEIYEQKIEKLAQPLVEQCEKETKSKNESHCSQQTPLMFSRCSSLGSLNGFEQNSINDDLSSIISDVSRRTSGIVSPSELPEQISLPGTRLQQKSQISFVKKKFQLQQDKLKNENNYKKSPIIKGSVFEDNVTSFKDESTPTKLHSVAASSLSSLTIDDDDDYELINKLIYNKEKQGINEKPEIQINRQEPIGESNLLVDSSIKSEKTEIIPCEIDEDINGEQNDELTDLTSHEEQLLDQCIRRGIAKWTKRNINEIKPFSWDVGLTCRATRAMLISRIRINSDIDMYNQDDKKINYEKNKIITNSTLNLKQKSQDEIEESNTYEKYSNEQTDSIQSNSNLKKSTNQFDQNSYYITYEEHLLDQCIRRGMAKITKRNINDIKPFSWDAHQICLTTRAMVLRSRDTDFYGGH